MSKTRYGTYRKEEFQLDLVRERTSERFYAPTPADMVLLKASGKLELDGRKRNRVIDYTGRRIYVSMWVKKV